MQKIHIFGRRSAGKTTLANKVAELLGDRAELISSDVLTDAEASRIANLANQSTKDFVVIDFGAVTKAQRDTIATMDTDITVWLDTSTEGDFESPGDHLTDVTHYMQTKDAEGWGEHIVSCIKMREEQSKREAAAAAGIPYEPSLS